MRTLFPFRDFEVKLNETTPEIWEKLKNKTEIRSVLVSVKTTKPFIGQVEKDKFRVITSTIGLGALCIFEGEFNGLHGSITVQLNKAFKNIMLFFITFWSLGAVVVIFSEGLSSSIDMLLGVIIFLLMVRVLIEFVFNSVLKSGLNQLSTLLEIDELHETTHRGW